MTLHTARDSAARFVRGSGLSARPGIGQLLLLGVAVLSGVAALAVASISRADVGIFGAQVFFPAAVSGIALAGYLAVSRAALQARVSAENAERFSALVQSSSDVVAVVSAAGSMRYISPSVTAIFGHLPEDLSGKAAANLVHPDDRGAFRNELRHVIATPGASEVVELRLSHSDGSWRHAEIRLTNLLRVSAVHGIVLNTRDVTDRRLLEEELRHQAFHDSLTGLGNRSLLTSKIEQALTAARRDGTSVAVLCCEIDQRRRITDSLGPNAESNAVRVVAERLRGSVRAGDTVARIGGQEFGILLEHLNNPSAAFPAIQRIMAALRQPISLLATQVDVLPRVGIAISGEDDETAEDLLGSAAVAMQHAPAGESSYALFDPSMHAKALRRVEVESEMRAAIDHGEFRLHYQPTFRLGDGRLSGVEALVRWEHPSRGLVPPLEFVSLAEESGLIVPLGQWILKEGCSQLRRWDREIAGAGALALHINLSARQVHHLNIVRDVADAIEDFGLDPARLVLEITESILMFDTVATMQRLQELKSLGVRLAIDDFGTGYSSFAYLRHFPLDILKIDKSFVDDVATDATASALMDTMIRIGRTLNLETVAEGVEHVAQAERLRELGCDVVQGYLFSRPLSPADAAPLLRERLVAPLSVEGLREDAA